MLSIDPIKVPFLKLYIFLYILEALWVSYIGFCTIYCLRKNIDILQILLIHMEVFVLTLGNIIVLIRGIGCCVWLLLSNLLLLYSITLTPLSRLDRALHIVYRYVGQAVWIIKLNLICLDVNRGIYI